MASLYDTIQQRKKTNPLNVSQPKPIAPQQIQPAVSVFPKTTQPNIQQNFGMWSAEGWVVNPTIATKGNPVVKINTPQTTVDYSTLDKWGLQDEIARMTFRMKNGSITEDDAVNYNRLTRMLAEKNSASANAIDTSEIDRLRAEQKTIKGQRMTADEQALAAFKQAQAAQTAQKIAAVQEAGTKQREAAQTATSFSWFGRSTVNAEQQASIEKQTQQAILYENAASDLAIQKEQARLNGATSEVLAGYDTQIAAAQWQASKIRQDAVAEANKVNTEQSALFGSTLKDLIANSGLKLDVNDEAALSQVINISRNPDWSVNESVVAWLPKEYQALVRAWVTAWVGQKLTSAPKVERIGWTTKAPVYGYWDGTKFVTTNAQWVPTVRTGGWWGSLGVSTSGGWAIWWTWSATDLIDYNVKFKNQDQSNAFSYATRMIEASDIFNKLENDIAWMNKGEYIYQKSLGKLPYWSSLQSELVQQQEQAEQNFINSILRKESGAAISPSEYANAQKQYFPQPWNDAALIEQKRKNRLTSLKWISAATGNQKALNWAINYVSQWKPATTTPTKPTTTPVKTTSTKRASIFN